MKYTVFVDGQEGTTGLQINERLAGHAGIEVIKISLEDRKNIEKRKELLNQADVAFLCLPDTAAKESVSLVSNNRTRIIDASTAHRINPAWAYGLPELNPANRARIKSSNRVAVPGCYATCFVALMHPLISKGIVQNDYPVSCHAVSGYSGGGKKLIGVYEAAEKDADLESPRFYALGLTHKHLPEMTVISGLKEKPLFTPIVSNYYKGMSLAVPLYSKLLPKKLSAEDFHEALSEHYNGERFVKVMPFNSESNLDKGFFGATKCNGTNMLELYVFGDSEQIVLMARLDNLGKGSSGAAVQNMNIMLGFDEGTGLE